MRLREFLKSIDKSPSEWAGQNGIPVPIITRFLRGDRGISFKTAERIVKATGGSVRYEDLLQDGDIGAAGEVSHG